MLNLLEYLIEKAILLLTEKNFSQLPVLEMDRNVGCICEGNIAFRNESIGLNNQVHSIMDEPLQEIKKKQISA